MTFYIYKYSTYEFYTAQKGTNNYLTKGGKFFLFAHSSIFHKTPREVIQTIKKYHKGATVVRVY